MTLESAIRLTGLLIGFAFFLQSIEHLFRARDGRVFFAVRAVFSLWLISGILPTVAAAALFIMGVQGLRKFDGPYNGGSDRMGLLVLFAVLVAELGSVRIVKEAAFGYLAAQLVLSYVCAGFVKLRNPEWRDGRAMSRLFQFSFYPVSESLRAWGNNVSLMKLMAWSTLIFEILFPVFLVTPGSLALGLTLALAFHIANAFILGLNRFVWVWLAAFPSLLWFQAKILGAV